MISLCIISRKEDEKSLISAIESCIDVVDEVVVVDTGREAMTVWLPSQDEVYTNTGIEEQSLRESKIKVVPFKWINDFSAARNFAFSKATGDVIFWIDSDDTVTNPENLPKLAKLITDGHADWIYSRYNYHRDEWGQVDATHWKPRLFRAGTVKWEKSCHEDAVATTGVIQVKDIDTDEKPIVVEHHSDDKHHDESDLRNLGIMMEEYERDGKATDPRTLQYLGFCLEGMKKYADAIPFYNMHVAVSGSESDKFWSLQRLSNCLYRVGQERHAISVCMDALKLFPQWSTAYFRLAEIYYLKQDWAKTIEWTLVGLDKDTPDILDVINPLDYSVLPLGRLTEAYLNMGEVKLAIDTATELMKIAPQMPVVKDMYEVAKKSVELENYVRAFITVAQQIGEKNRVNATKLFDLIPPGLDADIRIQEAHKLLCPPKSWDDKEIAIYCGPGTEDWAYPSIFEGIGGSEEAVIMLSEQLAKKGYPVTVYNKCGHLKGEYNGVTYVPYFYFNPKDNFNTLISWRNPGLFLEKIRAKKKYLWLHDILYPQMINEKVIESVDKIMFLSKWHSENVPGIPKEKIYLTNNGINPRDFKGAGIKKPNSLIWSSSYDRGLVPFMENIWPLIKAEIPDVTIDIAYGTKNLEAEMDLIPHLREVYEKCQQIFRMPGVTHHGRLSHLALANLMKQCMVYPYASEFGETCNITSMKCQAAGCFVVTTSQAGGTPERVKFGYVAKEDNVYTDKKLQKVVADKIVSFLKEPITKFPEVSRWSWEYTADEWIVDLLNSKSNE